jgi:hypothetical protein
MVRNRDCTGSRPHKRSEVAHNKTEQRSPRRQTITTYGKRVLVVAVVCMMSLTGYNQSSASSLDAGGDIERRGSTATAEEWKSAVLASLMSGGPAMQHAAKSIMANDVQIRFKSCRGYSNPPVSGWVCLCSSEASGTLSRQLEAHRWPWHTAQSNGLRTARPPRLRTWV